MAEPRGRPRVPFHVSPSEALRGYATNPGRLTPAWAKKHGYTDVEAFKSQAQKKFSLIETGIADQPSCRLLLLNVGADLSISASS